MLFTRRRLMRRLQLFCGKGLTKQAAKGSFPVITSRSAFQRAAARRLAPLWNHINARQRHLVSIPVKLIQSALLLHPKLDTFVKNKQTNKQNKKKKPEF